MDNKLVSSLSKSDTLVFHRDDPTTRMLCKIYEGKGWDVMTESCEPWNIDPEDLKQIFKNHSRLVFLGHGSSEGLMGMFGHEVAKYMEDKKIFAIWCNADQYFRIHHLGKGQFITGNIPSEVWECRAAGCGNISAELMLENITYWATLCAECVEECLQGRVEESVSYIRKKYLERYGNHPVSIYNACRTQCLGSSQALPKKTKFIGEKLEEKDYPCYGFDEKAFLRHPIERAFGCPHCGCKDPSFEI